MKTTSGFVLVLLFGVATIAPVTACRSDAPKEKPFVCAPTDRDQEAVIALWRGGGFPMPGSPPPRLEDQLVFAAWADCAVLFHEGDALKIGKVPAARMNDLFIAIREAGFFKPPLNSGVLFPDGPVQKLFVRDRANQRTLSHYGPSDESLRDYVAKMGPQESPSREQVTAFIAMWDKIVAALGTVRPSEAVPYERDRALHRPR